MRGMRIGFEYWLVGPRQTGVGTAIEHLLAALCRSGSGHHFVTYGSHSEAPVQLKGRTPLLSHCGRAGRILWQQGICPRVPQRDHLDLYHATGYIASPRMRVPTVLSIYDTTAIEQPTLTTWPNRVHYRALMRRGAQAADAVLVPSHHVRARVIERLAVAEERVHVVPLGLAPGFVPIDAPEAALRLAAFPQVLARPYLLFVGNVERKKNLPVLLHVLARMQRGGGEAPDLVIAGKPGNASRQVADLVHTLGLDARVHLLGYVPSAQLVALYNLARAVVLPSLDEGFGLTPLESMACGTPALVSHAGALLETAGPAATFFDPRDSNSLAHAIQGVLQGDRAALAAAGRRWVAQYSWDAAAERVLQVYESVATPKVRRGTA
jgi:glycosyltransferase involved in cell wall biosynthesis